MLVRFFLLLKSAGVPVSITELMTLLEALQRGLAPPERSYIGAQSYPPVERLSTALVG